MTLAWTFLGIILIIASVYLSESFKEGSGFWLAMVVAALVGLYGLSGLFDGTGGLSPEDTWRTISGRYK